MSETTKVPKYQDDNRPERRRTDRHLFKIQQGDQTEELLFEPSKILLSETLAMEREFNLTWPQIIAGVAMGRTSAIAAVVWILRKRKNPKLRPSEIEFSMEDFDASEDPDYLPEYGGVPAGQAYDDPWPDTEPTAAGDAEDDAAGPKDSLTPGDSSSGRVD